MEIWVVEEDGKKGPFETYLLRERIEGGELSGDELAWHKDQNGWVRLREMDVFRSAFEPVDHEVQEALPPPLPVEPYPFLRFFARWFDALVYLLFFFSLLRLAGGAPLQMYASPSVYLYFLPFLLLEATMLHKLATTPGKYLLGLRVVTLEEKPLRLQAALVRSFRAFIVGLGLMVHPVLTGICHFYCIWYLLRRKETPWDTMTTTRVVGKRIGMVAVFRFSLLFVAVVSLLLVVLLPTLQVILEPFIEAAMEPRGKAL